MKFYMQILATITPSDSEIQSTISYESFFKVPEALAYRMTERSVIRSSTRRSMSHTTIRRTTQRTSATTRRTQTTTKRNTWIDITKPSSTRRPTTRRTTPRITATKIASRKPSTKVWIDVTTKRTTPKPPTTKVWVDLATKRTSTKPSTRVWIDVTTKRTTPKPSTSKKSTPKTSTTKVWVDLATRRTSPKPPTTKIWVSITKKPTTRRTTTTTKPIERHFSYDNLPPPPGSAHKPSKTKIEVKNVYNYHYPGYYSLPVPHYQHPGYYQTHSTYHYSSSDTGSNILGFYLGYKLAKLSTPTYSHQTFYDGYRPRYDHYVVHHYYHNANSVPKEQRIVSNSIISCVGDSMTVCPANTTSLCTNDGKLMCVVPASNLVDCFDTNKQIVKCMKSTISCVNNTVPECSGNKKKVEIDLPCISKAKVEGNIKYINNSIVTDTPNFVSSYETKNCTGEVVTCKIIETWNNCTSKNISCANSTAPECLNKQNIDCIFENLPSIDTQYVNNTETGIKYYNNSDSSTSVYWKWKRSIDQNFCVTVVAVPARRVPTQGEEFLNDASSVFRNFIETVWHL